MSDPLQDIMKERLRQDEKWGEQNHEPERWLIILGEEYGEACKAALEADTAPNLTLVNEYTKCYRKEIVQVAAVALAAIESLDRNNPTESEAKDVK